jgi:orotate phosphoribosyltransferase
LDGSLPRKADVHQDEVLARFRRAGALLDGHFRLSSGLHSGGYLQSALVLQDPVEAEALGRALADRVRGLSIQAVLSPALGGIVIGHEVARALGVRAVFAERVGGVLTLRRGFRLEPGERVLVVEDVVTTGKSTRETIDVATASGALIVSASSIIDRSGDRASVGVPLVSLVHLDLQTYEEADCPYCRAGETLVKPGSRPDPA